jgi:ubiquitin thioesterase OTU1
MAAVKSGYPPQSLTIVPELPLSSLGLRKGEQIIVSQRTGAAALARSSPPNPKADSPPPDRTPTSGSSFYPGLLSGGPSNAASQTAESDSVRTDGGFLVHRVSQFYKTFCSD